MTVNVKKTYEKEIVCKNFLSEAFWGRGDGRTLWISRISRSFELWEKTRSGSRSDLQEKTPRSGSEQILNTGSSSQNSRIRIRPKHPDPDLQPWFSGVSCCGTCESQDPSPSTSPSTNQKRIQGRKNDMALMLDGNSVIGACVRSNLCYLICLRHLLWSRAVTNWFFIIILLHTRATCSELQSNMSSMIHDA